MNSVLTRDEIRIWFKDFRQAPLPDHVWDWFDGMDKDGDGHVDWIEFEGNSYYLNNCSVALTFCAWLQARREIRHDITSSN